MPRSGRRDPQLEQFWRQAVGAWQQSGQSARAFAAGRGLSVPSLYAWRRELAVRDRARPAAPGFVPVRVVADARVEVVLPEGLVVRVPAGADLAHVARLVAALGAPPC